MAATSPAASRTWWDRWVALFAPPAAAPPAASRAPAPRYSGDPPRARIRAADGGRATRASEAPPARPDAKPAPMAVGGTARPGRQSGEATGVAVGAILPPDDPEASWRVQQLDVEALRKLTPAKLLVILSELSPDVSRALYDFLRMCNPGWTITAARAATAGRPDAAGTRDDAAQATVDSVLARLRETHGNPDVFFNRLFLTAWLRGAFFAEAVFDTDYTLADITAPDPITVRFRRTEHPIRGTVWELGQMRGAGLAPLAGTTASTTKAAGTLLAKLPGTTPSQGWPPGVNGGFTPLVGPSVRYVPVDPFPGSPYGRALCTPAVFSTIFLLTLLHDLQRVVQQQGWPRLDVELVMENLRLTMPPDDQDDPEAVRKWVEASIKQVQDAMAALKPDSTYVHTDVVHVNRPVGTVDANTLRGVGEILSYLERFATRALKTMPLAMGNTEGMSEANATRQWELQVAGIKSFQHLCEGMLEHLFALACQMAGTPAVVQVRFAELRAAELLRDAQVETLVIKNEREKYNAGWTGQDEGAMRVTGHPAVEKEPRAAAINGDLVAQTGNDAVAQDAMASDKQAKQDKKE